VDFELEFTVATSTTGAQNVAAATATKEGLWVRKLLAETHGSVSPLHLRLDNQAAVVLIAENTAGQSGRAKHFDVQFHFVHDRFQKGDNSVTVVSTGDQHADILRSNCECGFFPCCQSGLQDHVFDGVVLHVSALLAEGVQ
jgi:hypothetical protein